MAYRFQVTFPMDSGIPADAVTNTFHFHESGVPIVTDFDNVRDMLKDFYTVAPPGGSAALATRLSLNIAATAIVKAYDLADPEPRVPAYESTFAIAAGGSSTAMPSELAVVLSFQAERESGVRQSSRRNRVYLGPLVATALQSDRPAPTFISDIAKSARRLLNAADASVQWDWVVWSSTLNAFVLVNNGWVDNAIDIQRRRGVAASARTLWDDATP